LYYRFAGDVGVGSSLMAPKDKGEGEGSVACQKICGANNGTQQFQIMFMILEDQNILSGEE